MRIPFRNINKKKKDDFINSNLSFQNINLKFINQQKDKINKVSVVNKKSKNINLFYVNKQKYNQKNLRFIKREFAISKIIRLLLIQIFFELYSGNIILSNDSIVTLKVSGNGEQKIFNSGTNPNEIWIDNTKQNNIINTYNLNPTNIIKLKWTNDITNCNKMFQGCDTIVEMNFTDFDVKKCSHIVCFFKYCYSLISLDLSGFIVSNYTTDICDMFWDCHSLISLNLSTFDTSAVTGFGHMFCNCISLTSLDISNFNTGKAKTIDYMFNGCKNLTSLNLSNFVTTNVIYMDNMFDGCESLKILDFSYLDLTALTNMNQENNIFKDCKNLEYINIRNLKSNANLGNTFFYGAPTSLVVCIENNKIGLIQNILDNNNCILISCNGNLPNYKYKLNKDGCFIENCLLTSYKYEFQENCYEICPNNSKQRENSKELEGFELDEIYFCKPICNETFPFEIINTQECVQNCDINSIIDKSCIVNNQEKGNAIIFDALLKNVEVIFTSKDYNTSYIENGNNEIIKFNNLKVTLTTTKNQNKNEKYSNETTINLGECERIIKEAYNISYDEILFMKKIDVIEEGMIIPKTEFDVYYKINGINLIKLNLSYCRNIKIDISIPIKIEDNIDKYNSSSGYYNDICYISTSDESFDIPLKDRKEEFMNNNRTVCQENCFFSEYDNNINKVKCSCDVVESSSFFENIKIDKQKLYENFIDIKNIANINILKCYKVILSKKVIIKNYGSYFIMLVIIIHLIIIIIFYIKNIYNKIKSIMKQLSLGIYNMNSFKLHNKIYLNKEVSKNNKFDFKKKNKIYKQQIHNKKSVIKLGFNSRKNIKIKKSKNNNINIHNIKPHSNESLISQRKKNKFNFKPKKINNADKIPKQMNKIMSYNNEELNDLEYKLALKFDKRKYCEYYNSLLKSKHILIFTFCNGTDYNLKIIKIDLLLFNITLFFAVNTIFFNDNTMHKIYKNKGAFDIIGQLPQIIYSSLISMLFSMILEFLALTEGIILKLKQIVIRKEFSKKIKSLNNRIKIKFLLYFIISTIFLMFFWYYISIFFVIYSNTQIHLIKDTLLSLVLSLIQPFCFCLIPGMCRIPALSKHSKRYILYKFSKILQTLLI